MLFFFITCFSFILFFKYSLPLKPHPCWVSEVRLISLCFLKDFSKLIPASKSFFKSIFTLSPSSKMSFKANRTLPSNGFEQEDDVGLVSKSVLDLPELALECILERLSPDGLCRMACVCTSLRERCLSDHLWGGHMALKWGRIIGPAAHREWKWHISTRHIESNYLEAGKARGLIGYISRLWPVLLAKSNFIHYISDHNKRKIHSKVPSDSIVACYRALQTGKFWFPAQVYNRENGHVGFMLSCYDAELSYDSRTDTFHARYPPHGRRAVAIESGVTWDRLRAPPIDTSPHDLHISDCLNELRPKDHIEIQWRRNKQFPYGWWYGVVGHLETCDGNDAYCRCHESDIVVLEFSQYAPGSRWRHTIINRKNHREEGNEADGFYGGIRKLYGPDEISTWKQFWPSETLE